MEAAQELASELEMVESFDDSTPKIIKAIRDWTNNISIDIKYLWIIIEILEVFLERRTSSVLLFVSTKTIQVR